MIGPDRLRYRPVVKEVPFVIEAKHHVLIEQLVNVFQSFKRRGCPRVEEAQKGT